VGALLVCVIIDAVPGAVFAQTTSMERIATATDAAALATALVQSTTDRVLQFPGPRALRAAALDASSRVVRDALLTLEGFVAPRLPCCDGPGSLATPAPLTLLAARFGDRRRPGNTVVERHTNWSFACTSSTQIVAAGPGVVVFAGSVDGLGLAVVVAHSPRVHTVYGNLLSLHVREWEPVEGGDVLAFGVAEAMDGRRELHFEVRLDGVPENPAHWVRIPAAAERATTD
jgi:murein DD-endopeptidase MepM/ murein hydrolase activator NlpD